MRLVFLSTIFPTPYEPSRGTFNLSLVRALAAEHDVRVVTPIPWTSEMFDRARSGRLVSDSRETFLEGIRVSYPRYLFTPKILRRAYGFFMWRSIRTTILRLLESHRPEAFISYWAHPDGDVAVRAAHMAGVPSVAMVGGSDVLLFTKARARRRCIVNVLKRADAVVTVSGDLKKKVCGFGIPLRKVHLVERGVDRSIFHCGDGTESRQRLGIPGDARVVLWVGRMNPVKGLDVLIDASEILRRRGREFVLYLVGYGPLQRSLETEVVNRGLEKIIRFAGTKTHVQLPDWYRAADVIVLPSRSEGIPNVLRESHACGTPFVASRVGGIPELATDADFLVTPGDAFGLAKSIDEALSRGRPPPDTLAVAHDWSVSAANLVDIIHRLRGNVGQQLRARPYFRA